MKRNASVVSDDPRPTKKPNQQSFVDPFSKTPHEILLLISFHLSVQDLVNLQQTSKRFQAFGQDEQLWKAAFYSRFVVSRLSRLPIPKSPILSIKYRQLNGAIQLSNWLHEEAILKKDDPIDWKEKYKLHHKWATGRATANVVVIAEHVDLKILSRLYNGVIYTVDQEHGLRAWSCKTKGKLIACDKLTPPNRFRAARIPMCLTLDLSQSGTSTAVVSVAFDNGDVGIFTFSKSSNSFVRRFDSPVSNPSPITDMRLSWPFIVTFTRPRIMYAYRFSGKLSTTPVQDDQRKPVRVASMSSETVWHPKGLALLVDEEIAKISIPHSVPTFGDGWSAAIQELTLSTADGKVLHSRCASAILQGFHPSGFIIASNLPGASRQPPGMSLQPVHSEPKSLSYSHPYLLVSHSDNTIACYFVTSTEAELTISSGKLLTGHTAGICGVLVDENGKAISACTRGNEVRIWDLEDGIDKDLGEPKPDHNSSGVAINLKHKEEESGRRDWVSRALRGLRRGRNSIQSIDDNVLDYDAVTKGLVGFDDGTAAVIREQDGKQVMILYDFT